MLEVRSTAIDAVKLLLPKRHGDARGFFAETWCKSALAKAGLEADFVLDAHSFNAEMGTLRGLHFQKPPHAQAKIVRVGRGRIFDVAVDIRSASPTYGQHVSAEISAENGHQMWIPEGFAHGFCTLTPDTEVLYKMSSDYAPDHECGLAYDDPTSVMKLL